MTFWKFLMAARTWGTVLLIVWSSTGPAVWGEPDSWIKIHDDAVEQSRETGKPILVHFTSSDSSPECWLLQSDIFETDEFKKWAGQQVILLQLDYPQDKPQPGSIRRHNEAMKQKYKVESFPTIVLLDTDGGTLGRINGKGYDGQADPKLWTARIGKLILKPEVRKRKRLQRGSKQAVWQTDFDVAVKMAQEQNRQILGVFVSYGYGKYSEQLREEVFETELFKKWARLNVVLLEVDFGVGRNSQPDRIKRRNSKLYRMNGIPTVPSALFLHPLGGHKAGSPRFNGYEPGTGAEAWIAKFNAGLRNPVSPNSALTGSDRNRSLEWHTQRPKALAAARDGGKPVLAVFRDDEASIGARAMDAKVFQTDRFTQWARKNVVLWRVTFALPGQGPKQKTKWAKEYLVRDDTTVMLMDSAGHALARMDDYPSREGPAGFYHWAKKGLADLKHGADQPLRWYRDFKPAAAVSRRSGQPILALFVGAGPSSARDAMEKEVFENPQFAQWAGPRVVLLRMNFQAKEDELGAGEQEKRWTKNLGLRKDPTVILLDATRNPLARREGYRAGEGLEPFISWIDRRIRKLEFASQATRPSRPAPEPLSWRLSLKEAIVVAQTKDRPIMAVFTHDKKNREPTLGQRREIFETDQFRQWAQLNVVLVQLEYMKSEKSAKAMADLARKYAVWRYPAVIFMHSDGSRRGRMDGFESGTTVESWIGFAERIVNGSKG